MPAVLTAFALAKINLCLHVTGRRGDGYHLLDSLVAFADVGDTLSATAHDAIALAIDGPFGAGLSSGPDNLVRKAARVLAERLDRPVGASIRLDKSLPVASGIGGGSADAAATLRLLCELWAVPDPVRAELPALAFTLGADVPVCLAGVSSRMRGVGDQLAPMPLPGFGLLLVNPGRGVSTADVFHALYRSRAQGSGPLTIPGFDNVEALAIWLSRQANDLQAPALEICPEIGDVLQALRRTPGCLLARMSGSGATCFGLYATAERAAEAANQLPQQRWWIRAGEAGGPTPR